MKRVLFLTLLNFAVLITMSITATILFSLFGVQLEAVFGDYSYLACFSLALGFGGAIVSLLLSKTMAKWSTGAKTINGTEGEAERWLVETVEDLARRANLKTPEVAIYEGAANAFATGAFRNSALIAVSTDIMGQMTREELRAVLGHEMTHVSNGDMVTMCLAQGVLNTFVIFFSRVAASIASSALEGDRRRSRRGGGGMVYYFMVHAFELLFGVLASLMTCAFSRKREFAADAGSARLLGTPSPMIAALRRLGSLQPGVLPDSLKAFGIAQGGKKRRESLFATHPALERRIEALQNLPPA